MGLPRRHAPLWVVSIPSSQRFCPSLREPPDIPNQGFRGVSPPVTSTCLPNWTRTSMPVSTIFLHLTDQSWKGRYWHFLSKKSRIFSWVRRRGLRAELAPWGSWEGGKHQPCAPPAITHHSAVVLQDLAHHGHRHLAQVTREPLLLRERTRQDVATAPRPSASSRQSHPSTPETPH